MHLSACTGFRGHHARATGHSMIVLCPHPYLTVKLFVINNLTVTYHNVHYTTLLKSLMYSCVAAGVLTFRLCMMTTRAGAGRTAWTLPQHGGAPSSREAPFAE